MTPRFISSPTKPVGQGDPAARGIALFFGGFTLLNLATGGLAPAFDANLWWIDLRFLPASCAGLLLLAASCAFLIYALHPGSVFWRRLTAMCAALLAVAALANCLQFYWLLARDDIASRLPLALSGFECAALFLVARAACQLPVGPSRTRGRMVLVGTAALCVLLFPLLQMCCFGKTDYRRPADAAVVFGARAYADGRPSDALADRVRTGCELYRDGLVRKLVFSGGPGDGAVHETEAMKSMAVGLGVKPEDILLDKGGLNTLATVKNTGQMFHQWGARRVLVVSHAYHLPRIKLTYQRAGMEVYTVPARETYLLRQLPYNMLREVAALWVYYIRALPQVVHAA